MTLDRVHYIDECNKRWGGPALADARRNWHQWVEIHGALDTAMHEFRRDPFQKDIADQCQNPDGTLTAFLWTLQTAITPDRSCLYPLLDFEENFQKFFLRRGLIIYCTMILRELETVKRDEPLLANL